MMWCLHVILCYLTQVHGASVLEQRLQAMLTDVAGQAKQALSKHGNGFHAQPFCRLTLEVVCWRIGVFRLEPKGLQADLVQSMYLQKNDHSTWQPVWSGDPLETEPQVVFFVAEMEVLLLRKSP